MKVYITRDEDDDFIWVWQKPKKGNWKPKKIINYYEKGVSRCYSIKFIDFS